MKVISVIEDQVVIKKILKHLGLSEGTEKFRTSKKHDTIRCGVIRGRKT